MYIPEINKVGDRQEALHFMKKFSFATIVTVLAGVPSATHLPFLVEDRDEAIVLSSHFAVANPQSEDVFNCRPLIIFSGPHAYISPSSYEKKENVPTWNYEAVHVYGKAVRIADPIMLLEKTISFYEAEYLSQWNALSDHYKSGMVKGIVGFEVIAEELQAKAKLSQNRSASEQKRIIESLSMSGKINESLIAQHMVNNL